MSWANIIGKFQRLAIACQEAESLTDVWSDFEAAARDSSPNPPEHLRRVLEILEDLEAERPRHEIAILDHGTGTGINLFYLAALGYTNVWGANILLKAQSCNRIFHEVLGVGEDRIFVYDGTTLPFPDHSIQLIISQQVVEHVPDLAIDAYYADEGRVLRLGGYALHHVPHRFMPYDSHTETWFVHYVPRALQTPIYRALGHDTVRLFGHLFLRSPQFHMRRVRRYIGAVEDVTTDRLRRKIDVDAYDGPRRLRQFVGEVCRHPIAGWIPRIVLGPLMMLETVSRKPLN